MDTRGPDIRVYCNEKKSKKYDMISSRLYLLQELLASYNKIGNNESRPFATCARFMAEKFPFLLMMCDLKNV